MFIAPPSGQESEWNISSRMMKLPAAGGLSALSLVSNVHNFVSKSEAEVRSAAGHQTHGVVDAGCGEMTHCGPLVLFRVVDNHVSNVVVTTGTATCSAS